MTGRCGEYLESLVNTQLTSVCFVLNYINLQLDDAFLTVLSPPYVQVGEVKLKAGDAGYRDMLCERIGHTVVATFEAETEEIHLSFEDGSSIGVPLAVEEFYGREAAILQVGREIRCVWHGTAP